MTTNRNAANCRNHLYRLWDILCQKPILPQLDRFCAEIFKKNPQFGSRDRRCYRECLFAAVRFATFAAFAFDPNLYSQKDLLTPKILLSIPSDIFFSFIALRYQETQIPSSPEASSFASLFFPCSQEIQERYQRAKALLWERTGWEGLLLYHGVPLFFLEAFEQRFLLSRYSREQGLAFLQSLDGRPPLWIRIHRKSDLSAVLEELQLKNISYTQDSPLCLGLNTTVDFKNWGSFQKGCFEIQDVGSQMVGSALDVESHHYVWDACAGGGGKTLQIAASLGPKGLVFASDIRTYLWQEIQKRGQRARLPQIRPLVWDGQGVPTLPSEVRQRGGFDRILVDAPCSGSGVWRRNPDGRYRVNFEALEHLSSLQGHLLGAASQVLAPQGRLVYATCSWLPAENEAVIDHFLKQSPQFRVLEQKVVGSPDQNGDTLFFCALVYRR